MKVETVLRRLAEQARREPVPQVDVTTRVMAVLCEQSEAREPFRWLAWVTAAAVAAAVPAAVVILTSWASWADLLLGLSLDLPWGLL